MVIPAAMQLEIALDMLKADWKDKQWVLDDQQKELTAFGDVRAEQLGASGLSNDFRKGYEFGLQVARVMIRESTEVILKGCHPEDIL